VSTWAVQDAKARFSELLDEALEKGPQVVTRRGVETAVVVPIDEWRRLQETAGPGLKAWLLAPQPRFDIVLPKRGGWKRRKPLIFK
jgi:antitoxin Phd